MFLTYEKIDFDYDTNLFVMMREKYNFVTVD